MTSFFLPVPGTALEKMVLDEPHYLMLKYSPAQVTATIGKEIH
jgi:hypothetical protein